MVDWLSGGNQRELARQKQGKKEKGKSAGEHGGNKGMSLEDRKHRLYGTKALLSSSFQTSTRTNCMHDSTLGFYECMVCHSARLWAVCNTSSDQSTFNILTKNNPMCV